MHIWALIIAALGVAVLVRALRIGSASIDGTSLRKDEEPAIFWFVIAFTVGLIVFLLWVGLRDYGVNR